MQATVRRLKSDRALCLSVRCEYVHLSDFRAVAHASWQSYARALIAEGEASEGTGPLQCAISPEQADVYNTAAPALTAGDVLQAAAAGFQPTTLFQRLQGTEFNVKAAKAIEPD